MTRPHPHSSLVLPAHPLLTAQAVRAACAPVMEEAEAGLSAHFVYHADRLEACADYVADTIRQRHPDLRVPFHSRWRHFEAGGADRWAVLRNAWMDDPRDDADIDARRDEIARCRVELAVVSVLLDAGAGPDWRYEDPITGRTLARSEGLGVASLALYASGALSADPEDPLRADAEALAALDGDRLAEVFQVSAGNPLVGVAGRVALLRRLGEAAAARPLVFGVPARIGHLHDEWRAQADATDGRLPAEKVLETLLATLGGIWPGRMVDHGVPLGDCWPHPAAPGGLVPFHKLTQWMSYSMLEPLMEAGIAVTDLDALTGLPEYRNGGLLLDTGVLVPRDARFLHELLRVEDPAVIEWRALTVALLDRLAGRVRDRLGVTAEDFPLARVLEGGTWAAGRRVAAERRPDGGPPVRIDSDGTVF